jgi:hypothetical protein
LSDTYQSLRAFAKAIGRAHPTVLAWFDDPHCAVKREGPWTDADVETAKAYAASRQPNRNYRQRQPAPPSVPPAPSPVIPQPATQPSDVAAIAATLEDLERSIRGARSNDEAERLSKQVRALKVVREILDRDGMRVDASKARADVRSVFHFFQTACLCIPRAVAGTLEGLTAAEIEAVLEGRFTEVLGELKRGLQDAIDAQTELPVAVGGDGEQPGRAGAADAEPVGGEVPDLTRRQSSGRVSGTTASRPRWSG